MKWIFTCFYFLCACFIVHDADGTCSFPSQMQKDFTMIYITPTAVRGDTFSNVTISASSLNGMSATGFAVTNTVWNCQLQDGDTYALRGTQIGDFIGTDVYLYFGFTYYFCANDSTNITASQTFCLIKPITEKNSDTYDLPIKTLPTSVSLTAISQISSSNVPENEFYLLVERTGTSYDILALMNVFQSVVTKLVTIQNSSGVKLTANISVLISILFLYVLRLSGLYPK